MDGRLLNYYERELRYLREGGAEFAKEYPTIAGRLLLDEFACADPYVERLLEGFAFLAARVNLKLDAEFPRLTQSLLQTIYPHYLSPTPSMCVVQFQPEPGDPALDEGFRLPRQSTAVRNPLGPGQRTACEYRTAHDVTVYPVVVEQAQYATRELPTMNLPAPIGAPSRPARAGVVLRLRCLSDKGFAGLKLDALPLFIRGTLETQSKVYEQVFAQARAVVIQPATKSLNRWAEVIPVTSDGQGIRRIGFGDDEALLPYTRRSFHGYRLLHEYFAFPQRFMFFELNGLAAGLRRCKDQLVDVTILMEREDLRLESALDASNFVPYCTPAINLFPKTCDRIHVADRFNEFHVVPDRNRPMDFEVYDVTAVSGYGEQLTQEKPFLPFYFARDYDADAPGAYYTMNRLPRAESQRERKSGTRSKYTGSEVYISLVDAVAAPYASDLRQLGIKATCTNRDLPLFLPADATFALDNGGPVSTVHCVSGQPTTPRASYAEGQIAWRLISHLSLNYLSLVDSDRGQGAAGLREILSLYANLAEPDHRKQIDGIKSIESESVVRRAPLPGPIAFVRGLKETVTLDEAAFVGTGPFLLGAVLEQFFAKYVSINSFTETVVKTIERGEIMRWPPRIGHRKVL